MEIQVGKLNQYKKGGDPPIGKKPWEKDDEPEKDKKDDDDGKKSKKPWESRLSPLGEQLIGGVDDIEPGTAIKTIARGKVVPLQAVQRRGNQVFAVDPENPDRVLRVKRDEVVPVDPDEEEGAVPGQP